MSLQHRVAATLRRRGALALLVAVAAVIGATALICTGSSAPPAPFAGPLPAAHEGLRLIVVGDLQRTAPVLEGWREHNDAERARVVAEVGRARPDLLLITGDCVFDGGSDAEWAAFDRLVAPLRARAIPAIAAFGNHEYWRGRGEAEAHLFPRFPLDRSRHHFTVELGPLRLVVLDSNADDLSATEWNEQRAWLARTLASFDADRTVSGVIVALHHPPYTNSTYTGDESMVQRDLVPPFAHARKTLAMLSGHVHSYERFTHDDKTYVVSGGGGGPRAPLATGSDRRHPDDLFDGPVQRDFHFTVYTIGPDGVHAEVRGLPRGGARWQPMDHFELPWPR